jgi:protein phosphatase PTC7
VLKGIDNSKVFTISQEATISDAVAHLVQQKISATLVIDRKDGSIVGIFTARDLLKCICEYQNHHHPSAPATASSSFSDPESHVTFSKQAVEYINKTKITEIMTPRDRLVYCSPNDSLSRCREIMFQCKIRNLPIIDSSNTVKGILTMKIIADSSFNLMEIGGKKGFIHNVTGRRGLPNSAKVDMTEEEAKTAAKAGSSVPGQLKLDMELGLFALPHPFKSEKGVSNNRRDYGAYELSTDLQYCEDAFFAIRLKEVNQNNPLDVLATPDQAAADPNQFHLPLSVVSEPSQVYFCVADGVGSWRQYGIDPRDYSHR